MNLPNISTLRTHNPTSTEFIENYLDKMEDTVKAPAVDQRWLAYNKISPNLKKTVLISEDDAFFDHHGFDWKQINESIEKNWKKKKLARGGSTITQQLVKNLYLGPSKTIFRKMREWVITYQMEKTLTKTRIFEIYLNVIEWGPGVYGADAAAHYYFGKSASILSPQESAFLAAIIPNPVRYGSKRNSKWVAWKTNLILKRMRLPPAIQEQTESVTTKPLTIPDKELPTPYEADIPEEKEPEPATPEPLIDY